MQLFGRKGRIQLKTLEERKVNVLLAFALPDDREGPCFQSEGLGQQPGQCPPPDTGYRSVPFQSEIIKL